jgi:hypothetical protein
MGDNCYGKHNDTARRRRAKERRRQRCHSRRLAIDPTPPYREPPPYLDWLSPLLANHKFQLSPMVRIIIMLSYDLRSFACVQDMDLRRHGFSLGTRIRINYIIGLMKS